MLTVKEMEDKWAPVLDHKDLPVIDGAEKRAATLIMLENTEQAIAEDGAAGTGASFLTEAAVVPSNATGNIQFQDPIMISMLRRSAPAFVAHDIAGVQPMSGPNGLIFFIKAHYTNTAGAEAGFGKPDEAFGGAAAGAAAVGGTGMDTVTAEAKNPAELAVEIGKATVVAKSRLLKAEYSFELAQDMKKVHGLNAETELSRFLSQEIVGEINREMFNAINLTATTGAQTGTAVAGTFNLDTDSNGRWMAERFKGLMFQVEKEANQVQVQTRRGRANILICSPNVASALSMSGGLDSTNAFNVLNVDAVGNSFAGVLNGRYKVYIDPYAAGTDFIIAGYKGANKYDAGIFYAPYVPMQLVRAQNELTFQPKIAFRTRYGMVANPFATSTADGAINAANPNLYYNKFLVTNLM